MIPAAPATGAARGHSPLAKNFAFVSTQGIPHSWKK
jgi:hypothetical protein